MTKVQQKRFKVGAYIRVSTEEQTLNPEGSIKNQEQRIREYINNRNRDGNFGELVQVFCDAGISAKDMKRPSLQKLITQIRMGEINLLIATDLSRLTRSTKDFGEIWEFLQEYKCSFLSLRENFDTTNAAGEMMIYTMATLAQFERKQTAERISHAFLARAKRGLYNGGSVPLGFRHDEANRGHLVVVPEEAEIVKLVFNTYLLHQTLASTAKALNEMNVNIPKTIKGGGRARGNIFRMSMIHGVLIQKGYLGVRVFKVGDEKQETKASWEPIVDEATFNRVQKMLLYNKSKKKPHSHVRYPYLLSGFIFCEKCGDRLAGKSAHGKTSKIAYYEHGWATRANANLSKKVFQCDPHRILAMKIEPVVWQEVKSFIMDKKRTQVLFSEAQEKANGWSQKSEIDKIKTKLASVRDQSEAIAERMGLLPKGLDPSFLFDQMGKLQVAKKEAEDKLAKFTIEEGERPEPAPFEEFDLFAKKLREQIETEDPVIKSFLIQSVVSKITVNPEGFTIHFLTDKESYCQKFEGAKPSGSSLPRFVGTNQTQSNQPLLG